MSHILEISALPPIFLENYRRRGWSDEELLKRINGIIDLLNPYPWSGKIDDEIAMLSIFLDFL